MIASVVKIEDAMNSAFDIYEQNSHLDIEQFTSADIPVVSVASLLQCLESLVMLFSIEYINTYKCAVFKYNHVV